MSLSEQPIAGHLFLSDVHLGAFSAEQNQALETELVELISYCSENQILVNVLGDLFDYWMEYPKQSFVPSLGVDVLDAFEEHHELLGTSLYITGNHDHWTFGHFKKRGFDVEHSFRLIELDGKRILLAHGDGMLNSDYNLKLPLLNKILKNKSFIKLFQILTTPATGLHIMKWFSGLSKHKTPASADRLNTWASRCLTNNEIDIIIAGDDHIPRLETLSYGTYINTGTFFNHRTVGLYKNNEYSLVTWNATQRSFSTYTR